MEGCCEGSEKEEQRFRDGPLVCVEQLLWDTLCVFPNAATAPHGHDQHASVHSSCPLASHTTRTLSQSNAERVL